MQYTDVNIISFGFRSIGIRVLMREIRERLKEILIELCEWLDDNNNRRSDKLDHVHMYLSVPPKYSPSHVMKILKGKSAEYLA